MNVKRQLDQQTISKSVGEFMRFEAELTEMIRHSHATNQYDTQEQVKVQMLESELEQLRFLVKIKLEKQGEGGNDIFN